MKKVFALALALWLAVVALSLWWEMRDSAHEEGLLALETARTMMAQIAIAREWNARLGGVYAFVSDETRPNEYLTDPDRDIKLPDGRALTKINPAYMTRQLSELSARETRFTFRITSTKPLRPANAPLPWEKEALGKIEKGADEVSQFLQIGDKRTFYYMAPLRAGKDCLRCHEKQGVKEGDLRGGVSIEITNPPDLSDDSTIFWHVTFAIFGAIFISYASRKVESAYAVCRYDATVDQLTRINNRRYFIERYEQELKVAHRQGQPMALLMADVDHFKLYNDAYGHVAGDHVLAEVAKIFCSTLARPTDLCARYGGEEFISMLPDTTESGALHVAERIRQTVEKAAIPHKASPTAKVVTISIGVTVIDPAEIEPGNDLKYIERADGGLYRAKGSGRNRVSL